ncbi:MAG: sulfite exporter TauE/SafE family protein [Pseudomonadota bacterium]
MDLGLDVIVWDDLLPFVLALLAAGVIAGFLAGLLGIGGGGILVPILYELFTLVNVDPSIKTHLAVGTSLAVIIPTSIRSFMAHNAKGVVDKDVLQKWGLPVFFGVLIGVALASFIDGAVLRLIYALTALIIAVKLFFISDSFSFGSKVPGPPVSTLTGGLFGIVSTLMGIGGGVLISTMMTLYSRSIHQAVATASGFGPIIAVPAVLGYIWAGWGADNLPLGSIGYVSLIGCLLVAPLSVLAAPIGVRVSHGLSKRKLEIAFGIFLSIMSARFLWSLIGDLG